MIDDLINTFKPMGTELFQYDKRLPMAILLTKFGLLVCVHRKYSHVMSLIGHNIDVPTPNFPMAQMSMALEYLCFIAPEEVLDSDVVIKVGI